MSGARVNEAVTSTARALHDSVHSFVDICNRQHPFEIPVSHLVRIEKDRGFQHEPTYSKQETAVSHIRRNSCHRGRLVRGHLYNAADVRQSVTAFTRSPVLPHRRPFSSQKAQQTNDRARRPLVIPSKPSTFPEYSPVPPPKPSAPVRKPPIPPRKPPAFNTRRSNLDDEDDVLARIAKTTGKEQNIRRINQLEQKRKRENLEDKTEGPRKEALIAVATKLEVVNKYVQLLIERAQWIRAVTLSRMQIAAMEAKEEVDDLQGQIYDAIKCISLLPKEIQPRRKEAARTGRKDYQVDQHFQRTGLASFRRQVGDSDSRVHSLRQEFADLLYTIDWTAWNVKRQRFLFEGVIEHLTRLKLEDGLHRETNHKINDIKTNLDKVEAIMLHLSHNLAVTCGSLSRSEARRYLKISTTIGRKLANAEGLAVIGHRWRKYDRFALVESQFPELNHYVSAEIAPALLIDDLVNSALEGYLVLRSTRHKEFWPVARQVRRAAYQTTSDVYLRYLRKLQALHSELGSFCREGLFLLNPALRSDLGRLIYAALYPFKVYNVITNQTEGLYRKACDDGREILTSLEGFIKRKNKGREFAKSFGSMQDRLKRLIKISELAEKQAKQSSRPFLQDLNVFTAAVTTRLLKDDGNDPNLSRILSRMNERAKILFTEEQEIRASESQLDRLSSPVLYRSAMAANTLMDPLKLCGNGTLYHEKDSYPVEFLSSEARVVQLLQNITSDQVVGVDMIGRDQEEPGEYPSFISIATADRIFLIDWQSNHEPWTAWAEFMENPEIVKVTYDARTLTKRLSSFNKLHPTIRPRGFVSIGRQAIKDKTRPVDRLTSAGLWKPVEHNEMRQGSLLKFFTDFAFLSTYNLWTFLSAHTPDQVSSLTLRNRSKILRTRERLQHRIAAAGDRGLEFGPAEWDHAGFFARLKKSLSIDMRTPGALKCFVGAEAQKSLGSRRREGFDDDVDPIGHAAYFMFTSFKEDLPTIGALFEKPSWSIAQRVLEVTKALKLTLHTEDLKKLEKEAETDPEKLSAQGVTPVAQPDEDLKSRAQKTRERRDKEKRTAEEQRKTEEKRKAEERQKEEVKQVSETSDEQKQETPSVSKSQTSTIGSMFEKGQSFIASIFTKTIEVAATTNETTMQGNAEYSPFQPSKPSPKIGEIKETSVTGQEQGDESSSNPEKDEKKDTRGLRQTKAVRDRSGPKKLRIRSVPSTRIVKEETTRPISRRVPSEKQKSARSKKDRTRHRAPRISKVTSRVRARTVPSDSKTARPRLNDPAGKDVDK